MIKIFSFLIFQSKFQGKPLNNLFLQAIGSDYGIKIPYFGQILFEISLRTVFL